MASPTIESFCCLFRPNTTSPFHPSFHGIDLNLVLYSYNLLCIVSSSISIGAAFYQIFRHRVSSVPRARKELESFIRQNTIICWLTLADFLASLGILLRSFFWLIGYMPFLQLAGSGADFAHLFCAISSAWIQYFYICTYFWTLCYALDVYFLMEERIGKLYTYHLISWLIPVVLCVGGLLPIYLPSLLRCELTLSHLLPHYLSTYMPILVVMIAKPILYTQSSKLVSIQLKYGGRFTDQERAIVRNVRHKFCQVTLVFYVCWFPNILNGILMMALPNINVGVLLGLWMFMAVVNPLQAFLNMVVYSGIGGWFWCRCSEVSNYDMARNHIQGSLEEESNEASSLLSFHR